MTRQQLRRTRRRTSILSVLILFLGTNLDTAVWADPCGMVPPLYTGPGPAITRVGVQKTYVFYKDGIETFVIRPGFSGKVDQFGMLIPFPAPPAIRKVPDDIFAHLAAAIDPPEVVVDLRPRPQPSTGAWYAAGELKLSVRGLDRDEAVRVISEEAVGMYEVAVLDAGSASALAAWMDEHGYKYPEGMDDVCEDYVQQGWCFVAVKTKVGQKKGVDPRPGMRTTDSQLPAGSTFDGNVQAMGFRFRVEELVVPMRLSTFNEGDLHNIVYILTDDPQRVRDVSESDVVRQIPGEELYRNLIESLPLRVLGGTEADIPAARLATLPAERDPAPHNGYARDLFGSDLVAVRYGRLANAFEQVEKQLLAIGERLGLRGDEIDVLHHQALAAEREKIIGDALADLREMTLTVVDGRFPKEVLSRDNLHFEPFAMAASRNSAEQYDAKRQGPAPRRGGVLVWGTPDSKTGGGSALTVIVIALSLLALAGLVFGRRRSRVHTTTAVLICVGLISTPCLADSSSDRVHQLEGELIQALVHELRDGSKAEAALAKLRALPSERTLPLLFDLARTRGNLVAQGWAIVGLTEIGGEDTQEYLTRVLVDSVAPPLVRTWAAAGRVKTTSSLAEITQLTGLCQSYPAIRRPIALRITELVGGESSLETATQLIDLVRQDPIFQQNLTEPILALGPTALVKAMTTAPDQWIRQMAAAYLATMGTRGRTAEIAELILSTYRFDPDLEVEPWGGGPLFVPGIDWSREDAKALAGNLISWHVWADRFGRAELKTQIHNNLRSLQLAAKTGYTSPGWQQVDTVKWLEIWGGLVGREALRELLREQGVEHEIRYEPALAASPAR